MVAEIVVKKIYYSHGTRAFSPGGLWPRWLLTNRTAGCHRDRVPKAAMIRLAMLSDVTLE